MNQPSESREFEWHAFYEKFSRYFSAEAVREGCYPRIMEHAETPRKAIVLVHGLSDSPYFMTAIGRRFYETFGYNVYIPLLHAHGLREPNGMEGVELEEWKANVAFAVNTAAQKCDEISIGGLSTGGTLSFYTAVTRPQINGGLYLFSAALDLAGGRTGLIGELKERLLGTFLVDVLDRNEPLIGTNPYRYSHVDLDGARELARLIKETDTLMDGFSSKRPFPGKVFAAHSESDTTASITGIEALQQVSNPERFTFFRIAEREEVSHASLVLQTDIAVNGQTLEAANPLFDAMLASAATVA